jgi:(S)-sulfolactate dehydrogenase
MDILITEFMDADAVDTLRSGFGVTYDPRIVDRRDDLLEKVGAADALIVRNRTQVNVELLAQAPRLRVVGRLGVGLDNIDVPACRNRGIEVIPATGANALAVAEYVVCTVMMLLRGAYLSSGEVAAGRWPRGPLGEGRETAGKTLGIVGFGGIGRLVARLARGLGMEVVAADALVPPGSPAWAEAGVTRLELDALLSEADAVTLHVPLTDETRHLIDGRRIAAMRPGAVLVNTARGGVVDEAALAAALRDGRLAGAALDVFEREPLPADSPLAGVPNLVLTPHIAGVTRESNRRVSSLIAAEVGRALSQIRPS